MTSNTKIDLNYVERSIPYRAVNKLRLGNENQSVNPVWGSNRCLFCGPYKTQMLSGQKVECIILTLFVHKRVNDYLKLSKISIKSITLFPTLYLVPSME